MKTFFSQSPHSTLPDAQQEASLRVLARGAEASVEGFQQATQKHGSVIRCLTRSDDIVQNQHYPDDDVVDEKSGAHYFYHAHRSAGNEHGHLHLFWHADTLGRRVRRRSSSLRSQWAPSHLFAIGLDASGIPISLFTTNLWVTDGHWFDAPTTLALTDRFVPGARGRYACANRFVKGLVAMYRPLIEKLLIERDRKMQRLLSRRTWDVVSQDTRHEVLSHYAINWVADIEAIDSALDAQ